MNLVQVAKHETVEIVLEWNWAQLVCLRFVAFVFAKIRSARTVAQCRRKTEVNWPGAPEESHQTRSECQLGSSVPAGCAWLSKEPIYSVVCNLVFVRRSRPLVSTPNSHRSPFRSFPHTHRMSANFGCLTFTTSSVK